MPIKNNIQHNVLSSCTTTVRYQSKIQLTCQWQRDDHLQNGWALRNATQLVMCAENGKWCAGTSYKMRGRARAQLTGNSAYIPPNSNPFSFSWRSQKWNKQTCDIVVPMEETGRFGEFWRITNSIWTRPQVRPRLSNSTEQSLSWETSSRSANHDIPIFLWNPMVHHRVHISRPLISVLVSFTFREKLKKNMQTIPGTNHKAYSPAVQTST
jgi:hypothetical protein